MQEDDGEKTDEVVQPTPDNTTSPDTTRIEAPYRKPQKLRPCQRTPPTLYELAAPVVNSLRFPAAFHWPPETVAGWMEDIGLPQYKIDFCTYLFCAVVDRLRFPAAFHWPPEPVAEWMEDLGLPQYKECILDNHINGRRLLMLEDPNHLPLIGVRDWEHVKMITAKVRELFNTEFIRFCRSIGLPTRKPLTHCTWFKSRTGPTWGIRQNWTRCDVLRAMEIIMPAPIHLDHWDLVWYHKPDFPKVKFARIPKLYRVDVIPHYKATVEVCNEILVPRKFILERHIPKELQLIWMQRVDYPPLFPEKEKRKRKPPKPSRLVPKPVTCEGLRGKQLILARRKMSKPKFLP